jgi:hypothetical protein
MKSDVIVTFANQTTLFKTRTGREFEWLLVLPFASGKYQRGYRVSCASDAMQTNRRKIKSGGF